MNTLQYNQDSTRKAILEVNLSALLHNINVLRGYLNSTTKIMAMVKASAYGAGDVEVTKFLEKEGVEYFSVAYTNKGINLRKAGVKAPIMVINPNNSDFSILNKFALEPGIYNRRILSALSGFSNREKKYFNIHIEFDTGMKRLGFEEHDLMHVIELLKNSPYLKVKSIFSHLVASGEKYHNDFTRQQFRKFKNMYDKLVSGIGYKPMRHILNSAGVALFPEYQFDMVRPGISIYGADMGVDYDPPLKVVNTFKAIISQIRNVKKGETIGYSRMGKAESDKKIAVLNLGYEDGFLRKAGNGNYSVFLNDKKAPTIGNICMDMCMIDITEIPEAKEGDAVEIFGKNLPVEELAGCFETIPYEIFTNISERVKRVYV